MDALLLFFLVVAALVAFGVASLVWGVDSRDLEPRGQH